MGHSTGAAGGGLGRVSPLLPKSVQSPGRIDVRFGPGVVALGVRGLRYPGWFGGGFCQVFWSGFPISQ
jgi:hypothetical protein